MPESKRNLIEKENGMEPWYINSGSRKTEMIKIMKEAGTWDEAADADPEDILEPEVEIQYSYGESCSRRCHLGRIGICSDATCPYI